MKAVCIRQFGDSSVLEYGEMTDPVAKADELLIKVEGAGVGFPDVEARINGSASSRNTDIYRPISFPHILGLEVSGTVVDVGSGVSGWKPGDTVMSRVGGEGGYAELVAVPAWQAMPRPMQFKAEEAAAFPVSYLTAYHAVHTAGRVAEGETVLVHAASGALGLAAIQLAKAAGATVIGVTSSTAKAERLAGLQSVDRVIDTSQCDFVSYIKDELDDKGVDLVLDSSAGESLVRSLDVLKPRGRLVTVGYTSGDLPDLPTAKILFGSLSVIGMNLSDLNRTAIMDRSVEHLLDLAQQEKIKPVVDRCLPLTEAAQAHQLIEGRQNFGKVVLIP